MQHTLSNQTSGVLSAKPVVTNAQRQQYFLLYYDVYSPTNTLHHIHNNPRYCMYLSIYIKTLYTIFARTRNKTIYSCTLYTYISQQFSNRPRLHTTEDRSLSGRGSLSSPSSSFGCWRRSLDKTARNMSCLLETCPQILCQINSDIMTTQNDDNHHKTENLQIHSLGALDVHLSQSQALATTTTTLSYCLIDLLFQTYSRSGLVTLPKEAFKYNYRKSFYMPDALPCMSLWVT